MPRRIPLGFELCIVVVLAAALLVPGIWRYSLVDPWETHYGEVSRRMLADDDWVHTDWQNEGFRSKPVLTFWLMAASMRVLGHGADGGYSGEMSDSRTIVLAIRLPFTLLAVMGLTLMWWMLARLWSRRAAWLAFLVLGTTPFYFFIARQGITDMTLVSLVLGALSMFLLATEDGDAPVQPFLRIPAGRGHHLAIDARHGFGAIIGGFVGIQALYYLVYFEVYRYPLARVGHPGHPGWWFFVSMTAGTLYVLLPRALTWAKAFVIAPVLWAARADDDHRPLLEHAYELAEPSLLAWLLVTPIAAVVPTFTEEPRWPVALEHARRLTALAPLRRSGQVYMLWFWALVGISVLGKGVPGFGLAGVCAAAYVIAFRKWRDLARGRFEVKRGVVLLALTILPWHVAMYFRDGKAFIKEWVFTHNLNRAAVGVFGDRGTFDYCLSQVGYGMFVWVALVPMALAAAVMVPAPHPRAGRVRFLVGVWAIVATALFSLSQTKFHHYIFPAIPAFAILVGLWLDDLLAGRVKPSLVMGAFGAGVVLLVARDLMWAEQSWIEMFIFRHDRPWPTQYPWAIDPSDAFLGLGIAGAAASILLGTRWRRLAVTAAGATALATALWALHVYMPIAGTHWGMRDAVRRYYQERQLYGATLVYYAPRDFHDDWAGAADHWDLETFIPDAYQDGQPLAVSIAVEGTAEPFHIVAHGPSRAVGPHTVRIALAPADAAAIRARARTAAGPPSRRRPVRAVDADRLIAWQLYWRGENFWSGNEIWDVLPEMQTAFKDVDNKKFLVYIGDRALAPEGRRYFVITEAGRTANLRALVPTETGRKTFQELDTTSNKFTLAVWQM